MANTRIYTPLDQSIAQLRLIRLKAQDRDSPEVITCFHHLASLDDSDCVYEALSYEWGDPSTTTYTIRLNGHKLLVRENLWRALWHLRSPKDADYTGYRVLWIDALSIDQSNDAEKNHQVCVLIAAKCR